MGRWVWGMALSVSIGRCSFQLKDSPNASSTGDNTPTPAPTPAPVPAETPKPPAGGAPQAPPFSCPGGLDGTKALSGGSGVVVAATLTQGNAVYSTGYVQVSANNQDGFLAKVTGGQIEWCGSYGRTASDERGVALGWVGGRLFVAFSVDGDSTSTTKFQVSKGAWQGRYGAGGGPKGAYIVGVEPAGGGQVAGTWFTPRNTPSSGAVDWNQSSFRNDGPPQSIAITGLEDDGQGRLRIKASVWGYGPGCVHYAGDGRRTYSGVLTTDLTTLIGGTQCPPPP